MDEYKERIKFKLITDGRASVWNSCVTVVGSKKFERLICYVIYIQRYPVVILALAYHLYNYKLWNI